MQQIPIVDLFAGPGGLGEGFANYQTSKTNPFNLVLSIEKERQAHMTLELRSFFRHCKDKKKPRNDYYEYLENPSNEKRNQLFAAYPEISHKAKNEALCLELGKDNKIIHEKIKEKIGNTKDWVLIGGPPCQAYSLIQRSRMQGKTTPHTMAQQGLYLHYLEVLARHSPPVFIMENVKGLLSAKDKNGNIFKKIMGDLADPAKAYSDDFKNKKNKGYKIFSLVQNENDKQLSFFGSEYPPSSYVVKCEDFSIPQARHRVILLGLRADINITPQPLRKNPERISMWEVIKDLPKIRSKTSKEQDSANNWEKILKSSDKQEWFKKSEKKIKEKIKQVLRQFNKINKTKGGRYKPYKGKNETLEKWFNDEHLLNTCNHESRGHIIEDLYRYLYAACFAMVNNRSPTLKDFPLELLPNHENAKDNLTGTKFNDRFRVQLKKHPSKTIASHISKDGHYYIHPDPYQCRSLTVREAARLQTFPDNYFFEGPRTAQYVQVGNAVPPFLANQIAGIIFNIFKQSKKK
jgi:DNA (cytosine-5)-methyltransferase 1